MSKFKEFIDGFKQTTQTYIEKYEKIQSLSNQEKKKQLDDIVEQYAETAINKINLNVFSRYIIKKFIINNIPYLTQAIFDLIKTKIEGVTK